eukprot:jgi/Tetstr1/424530/TSEL_015058.t1
MLAKEASEQSPCCSRKCVHKLYTQCGEALVDAALDRALTVYSGNQNRSFDKLAQVLRGGYKSASDKFDYMFDHGGYLRSFDHRGPIYTYDLGHVEIMPFHDGNNETFKKHLPPWMPKICVYCYYKSWAEDDNAILRDLATESEVKLASFDTFRRTWEEDFPDVTTPKVRIPKTVKPDMLLKYHLTCVKYDGYRPDDIYYYTNTIPHDSSTTCTLIWITIMKEIQRRGRKIPYIRIQMDNTVRENKNRNVAALCNWLVSIGICDVIHLVVMPVGHTHERVDQIFSRISLALSRSSAYTIEAFLDLVAKAFSPTPEIAELSFSLDFSEWLRPPFQDHIQDISKPHKFEFNCDDAAASGGSLRTALWSNTKLSEPVQILKSAPTGTPEIRAGRPLLYTLCDKTKPGAVKVQRYLDDFKKTAPVEARHTMATNADLNNAEAARVEAEVRAQVLQDDSAFRGVHAGAKERLHDNTSPSDAKGSNLVVIDVSHTKGGKKPVDTSWEKCLTLPWKLVEAVPLSYAKAIHDASGSREVFNEDGTMVRKKWYGSSSDGGIMRLRKPVCLTAHTTSSRMAPWWQPYPDVPKQAMRSNSAAWASRRRPNAPVIHPG